MELALKKAYKYSFHELEEIIRAFENMPEGQQDWMFPYYHRHLTLKQGRKMKFKDINDKGSGTNNFVKLKDGESITGIFLGDPYDFNILWENGKSTVVDSGTPKASFRFRITFVVKDGAQFTPKIFEQGLTVYKQLAELNGEYDLESTVVKITRKGSGTDTAYSILPMLKTQLTKEAVAYLATLEPLELKHKNSGPIKSMTTDELAFLND